MTDDELVVIGLQVAAVGFSAAFLLLLMLGMLFTVFAAMRHLMGVS